MVGYCFYGVYSWSACLVPYATACDVRGHTGLAYLLERPRYKARCAARRQRPSRRCRGKAMFHRFRIRQSTHVYTTTTTRINPFQLITINPNYSNKITKSSTSKPLKSHHFTPNSPQNPQHPYPPPTPPPPKPSKHLQQLPPQKSTPSSKNLPPKVFGGGKEILNRIRFWWVGDSRGN